MKKFAKISMMLFALLAAPTFAIAQNDTDCIHWSESTPNAYGVVLTFVENVCTAQVHFIYQRPSGSRQGMSLNPGQRKGLGNVERGVWGACKYPKRIRDWSRDGTYRCT